MITKMVGLRIKDLREGLGMSQETIANSIGMARTYFAEVETGKRNVSIRNLTKITKGLGVSLAEFFDSPLFDNVVVKSSPDEADTPERIGYRASRLP